jgi:hypothetical protein
MKTKLACSIGVILLAMTLVFPAKTYAKDARPYNKTIKKEFEIHPEGTTSLINKYGRMDIRTWDKNRVKVEVRIQVKASNESSAQKVFDRIDINFTNSEKLVKAVTFIEPKRKTWWGGKRSREKLDYSINYEVYLPSTNNLQLHHRYGEVFVGDMEGKVDLIVKYANLKVESVGDDSNILLAYGSGSVERSKDLSLDISYSKFYIRQTRDASIDSRYAVIQIREAEAIDCKTKYDDYDLGKVKSFKNTGRYDNIDINSAEKVQVNSKYTQLMVGRVRDVLDLDVGYGEAQCGIAPQFSDVSIIGSYTDVRLALAPGLSSYIDAVANFAGIRYPGDFKITYEKEKQNSHELKAETGNNAHKGQIKAVLSYGGLRIVNQ